MDHYLAAQEAAEEHLTLCQESLDDMTIEPDTMAPYCGCLTCEIREVLHAAMPHLRLAFLEEIADVVTREEFDRITGDES